MQELYNGLKNLLDYEEDDIEEMFMQTFRICYKDAFGEIVYRDLVDNGDQITVNHMNKRVRTTNTPLKLIFYFFFSNISTFILCIPFLFVRNLWINMQTFY